jgi:hypothetical protein
MTLWHEQHGAAEQKKRAEEEEEQNLGYTERSQQVVMSAIARQKEAEEKLP